jgi:hypothetical protein
MKRLSILFNLILLFGASLAQTGYDPDFWPPDIVTTKDDPFNLISSNFGQPAGNYNWNENQFTLMGRTQRTCNGCTEGGKHVKIQNLTLFVNDKEFFVKAVCYTPVPLGVKTAPMGGGRCSPRRTPFSENEFSTACFDSDYFDGGDAPGRDPPPPANGWFTDLWQTDFPIIKQSGANAIRIYNINPTTRMYTDAVLAGTQQAVTGTIVAPSYGKDHRPFMDAAYQAGLMVIYPLLGDQTLMASLTQDEFEGYLRNQIDEIGNHPALLMYTLGNELPLFQDANLLAQVNHYIAYSRGYSMAKWGRSIPITHAIVDNPGSYNTLFATLDVDVFTSNAGYRGLGFQDLWDGSQSGGIFDGLGNLSVKYGKPNFIGEIGWEQLNGTQTSQPINAGWFNLKWKDLIIKGTPVGCVGGAFFEYLDEVYTKVDPLQQTMGMVSPQVATTATPWQSGPQVPHSTVFSEEPGFTGYTGPTTITNTTSETSDGSPVQVHSCGATENTASNPPTLNPSSTQGQSTLIEDSSSETQIVNGAAYITISLGIIISMLQFLL